MSIPLEQLDAEVIRITFKHEGREHSCDCVFMDCPLEGCDHSVGVPFQKGGGHGPDDECIWNHISGTTIRDLTLAPSYHLRKEDGYCGLHGWIRDGHWVGAA